MAKKDPIEVGRTYSVVYPFTIDEYCLVNGEYNRWKPGCIADEDDDINYFANAEGEMLLTIVSKYKPENYNERVFYIRQWKDPDGNVFGNKKLRITTTSNFRRLSSKFRHRYDLIGVE